MENNPAENINLGFSSIYEEYEALSKENYCDIFRRRIIRKHVESFLNPQDTILEINAGSGIDAVYFAKNGYSVLATDIADNSEIYINNKIKAENLKNLAFQKCSFTDLKSIKNRKFNHIFSNYGGLNCAENLENVFSQFNDLLQPNGFVSLVIMPKYYPWEMATVLKGNKNAFRRWKKNGVLANVNGHLIPTFYYSPKQIKKAMGNNFKTVSTKNIGTFYPSLHYASLQKHQKTIRFLMHFDFWINERSLIPKGLGDYFIITFQKTE
ncbi:MAG TPA: class I SAM-dependent methyltransferase [Flavobacterium sp.]|uniref:class I SAM-dependent methyltransferase n=1 Tax=Flavobacterium sp. TaxID=239 RepID=UPI002C78533C|nr:class I SAM-dependent methyltransferase [Flavobacterium sp.]HNP31654.1 class I SAM-dependent methyltransferase [Flavobacterium sp.]